MLLMDGFRFFVNMVIIVGVIYLAIRTLTRALRGDYRHKPAPHPDQHARVDYTWRWVKVTYVTISAIIVIIAGTSTYEASKGYSGRGDMGEAYGTMITTMIISWLVYRFLLPRLYKYLKKPS
jgi:heme/copper-type cytochrome/quinol oxidase subunit 2